MWMKWPSKTSNLSDTSLQGCIAQLYRSAKQHWRGQGKEFLEVYKIPQKGLLWCSTLQWQWDSWYQMLKESQRSSMSNIPLCSPMKTPVTSQTSVPVLIPTCLTMTNESVEKKKCNNQSVQPWQHPPRSHQKAQLRASSSSHCNIPANTPARCSPNVFPVLEGWAIYYC